MNNKDSEDVVDVSTEESGDENTSPFVNRLHTRREFKHIASMRRKPKVGEYLSVEFPQREKDEDEVAYSNRCYEMTGCIPAPIGPMKKIGPNKDCPCGSKKKFKRCCGR